MIADPVGAVVAGAHDVPGEAVGKVPGEQEGDGALGAWVQVHGGGEGGRGRIGGAGRAVVKLAVGAEVVPEVEQGVTPGDVVPGGAGGDGLVGGVEDGEGQRAPLLGVGGHAVGAHVQAAEAVPHAPAVDVALRLAVASVGADEVGQGGADRDPHGHVRRVGSHPAEDGDGQAAVVGAAGDERVEGFEPERDGHVRVAQAKLRQRIGGVERGVGEARQTVVGRGRAERALEVHGVEIAFQQSRDRRLVLGLHAGSEEGAGLGHVARHGHLGDEALGGAVDDLPVAEISPPAERDGAGADAAEGHGHAPKMLAAIGAQDGPGGVEGRLVAGHRGIVPHVRGRVSICLGTRGMIHTSD